MHTFSHKIRVRYAECDRMGFVHHSVYALYFEEARTEMMRKMGITYKELEDSGCIMPVKSMGFEFKKAALYDDLIEINIQLENISGVRCRFVYEIRNQDGQHLSSGFTELFFARKSDLRPQKLPAILSSFFSIP
jgi:acyl-CoA thioester hydrolase